MMPFLFKDGTNNFVFYNWHLWKIAGNIISKTQIAFGQESIFSADRGRDRQNTYLKA